MDAPSDGQRLASERREAIRNLARMHGTVRVADLAQRFDVSPVTVRRDIGALVEAGELQRVHGGARSVLSGPPVAPSPDQVRIGVVLPAARYYFRDVLEGIKERAARSGVSVVLAISQYDETEERRLFERMIRARVGGILIATTQARPAHAWLEEAKVPVVLVERPSPQVEYARSDHAEGARTAVQHLHRAGHERIGLAVRGTTPTAGHLVEGYHDAMRQIGPPPFDPFELPEETEFVPERNQRMEALIEACRSSRASAVIVHPEGLALPLLDTARDLGIAVPGDLAMVTYDDELAQLAPVPLTAVRPPKQDVGAAAVDLLVRRITQPRSATQRAILVPELIPRESS